MGGGDPSAANMGNSYFSPELSLVEIGYTDFYDSDVLAAVDGEVTDSLLVSGRNGNMPALWRIQREQGMVLWDWAEPMSIGVSFPGRELAVGRINGDDRDDVAVLDSDGHLQSYFSTPNGFVPAMTTIGTELEVGLGTGLSGLVLHDINCDGFTDMIFNSTAPPAIQIVLGDGNGGIITPEVIGYTTSPGGQGLVGVVEFDNEDENYDLVHTLGGAESEVKVYTSTDISMMP
ncbi:MAG: hypothetical protein KC457_26140 [Myxococcales bacterium]|nr:hypothetical protein [Myxococcales bacterium]